MSAKHADLRVGLETVRAAVQTRKQINELYEQYRGLSQAAELAAQIKHWDFKRAVDALYYLGGGWPSPGSKGRMEALLDNFAGMYRVLHFIEHGQLVEEHLAKYGIAVSLDSAFAIQNVKLSNSDHAILNREFNLAAFGIDKPSDLKQLISQLVCAAEMIQGDICKLADTIKDGLRPEAQKALGVTDEEYDRIHDIVKISLGGTPKGDEKIQERKIKSAESIRNYQSALGHINSLKL